MIFKDLTLSVFLTLSVLSSLLYLSVLCDPFGLMVSNAHREMAISQALAGEGVVRVPDWTNLHDIASGTLVRVLADWESTVSPPVNLLYRASVRRILRVRRFIEFVTELIRDLDAIRGQPLAASARPEWMGRHYSRSSAMLTRGR